MAIDYEQNFAAWTSEQADFLRAGRDNALDITHLAEEVEDLGKRERERRALESRLAILMGHLLKWRYRPDDPNRKSWRATINTRRRAVAKLLAENPSLRPQLDRFVADAYPDALDLAVAETPLDYDTFASVCPWPIELILSGDWPGEAPETT